MRKVIFHYHLFKNAGTSVDALLKNNFPGRWVTREFNSVRHDANIAQVSQWIQQEKHAVAFSSHTAMLPPPDLEGVEFFPIVFVRHPIDRIASAYAFECKQEGDSFGAVLARNTNLAGYIDVRLSLVSDRQCRNFHVARLAQMYEKEDGNEFTHALLALNTLPFVGMVEKFDLSINRLCDWLSPNFPDFYAFSVEENVTRDLSIPLEQRLEEIRLEIGEVCYSYLLEANSADLAVFDALRERYDSKTVAEKLLDGSENYSGIEN